MCRATPADWDVIVREVDARERTMPQTILQMLRELARQTDGFAIDQLEHSLQTATRAKRAGADDEIVVAALCHDIGKVVSVKNHAAIGAEILRPYVSESTHCMLRFHQDFQGRHYYAFLGKDPDLRRKHAGEPWYELTRRFADEWDQCSFDRDYDSLPLEAFEELVERFFSEPRSPAS
jgi:predicted HD phosphohydrolase